MFDRSSNNHELPDLKQIKRRAELYLRSLWGEGFSVVCDEVDNLSPYSYIVENTIHLPGCTSPNYSFALYVRAASVHAGLHHIYGGAAFDVSDLNFMQRTVVGLVEDLRVELLAIRQFPGLKKLWLGFHPKTTQHESALQLMQRLSRSVLDPEGSDDHQWVQKGRDMILNNRNQLDSPLFSMKIGLSLANDLGQMRLPLNSGKYESLVVYRDDNRSLWQKTTENHKQVDVGNHIDDSNSYSSKLREASQGLQVELSDKEKSAGNGFFIRQNKNDHLEYRQHLSNDPGNSFLYPEWDYRSHVLKQDWCSVSETEPQAAEAHIIDERFAANRFILARLRHVAKSIQTEKRQRVRRVEDGEDVDLDPFIEAMLDMRMNKPPSDRVFMRNNYRKSESVAISILMDLSESTNEIVAGGQLSISEMMGDAVLLLGETLSIVDEKFSISGFSSKGRHEVNYIHYKTFEESFENSKNRLANINAQYSTRLGAAIRHCSYYLKQQEASKKLLLVITDGAPSDVDVYDERYLEYDSWEAVQSLHKYGIKSFGLNLDGRSDQVIEHIFGKSRCRTLDHINKLPEMLAYLYISQLRY